MRELIQKVIETEAEAKRMVAATKVEAEQIVVESQKQAQDWVAQARQETRREAEKLLAVMIEEAEQERTKGLAQTAATITAQIYLDTATV